MVDQMEAALLDDAAIVPLPGLRRLAGCSTRFTHAFTPSPICTPARASFQLGVPVHRHGVIGNDRSMPEAPTLADRLAATGYATSYVGKWHLDADRSRGWHRLITRGDLQACPSDTAVMDGPEAPHHGVAPFSAAEHIDGCIAQAGQRELMRLEQGEQPFALMISFYGPHAPYYLPAQWHGRFDPDELPLPATFDAPFEDKPHIQETFRCRAWGERWSEDKWRRVRAAYYGYVAMIDSFIGQLMGHVDLDNTAILFVSDHGENNGHLRMIYKGPMMYDTLVRIPALMHLPGQTGAAVDDRLVDLTDFTATLLARAGAVVDGVEGTDVAGQPWSGRDVVLSEFHEANWVNPVCRQRVAMVRDQEWKYVYYEGDRDELYDLRDRPMEVRNRISDPVVERVIARMRTRLAREVAWVAESMDVAGGSSQ